MVAGRLLSVIRHTQIDVEKTSEGFVARLQALRGMKQADFALAA